MACRGHFLRVKPLRPAPWIVLFWLLALPLVGGGVARGASHESEIVWKGEVTLNGPFVVPVGSTLVLEPGVIVTSAAFRGMDWDAPDWSRHGWILAHGRVLVRGTAEGPVILRAPLVLEGPGASGSHVEGARVEDAGGGECAFVTRGADVSVIGSAFIDNTRAVCVHGGRVEILRTEFLRNAHLGTEVAGPRDDVAPCGDAAVGCASPMEWRAGAPGEQHACWRTWSGRELCRGDGHWRGAVHVESGSVVVRQSSFAANGAGVHLSRDASAIVENSTFHDNAAAGVEIETHPPRMAVARSVSVAGSVFSGAGAREPPGGVFTHVGLAIRGPAIDGGTPAARTDVLVADNRFESNPIGLLLEGDASGVRFKGNTLIGNDVGLLGHYARATLEDGAFGNVRYDLRLWGQRGDVHLVNTTFDPAKVSVEGESYVAHDGGVIRNAGWIAILGSVAAILLLAASEAGRWILVKGMLAVGYSRIGRSRLLAHPARDRLLEHIRRSPGAHLSALVKEVGSYGAAVYHLSRMEREGLVRSARDGMRRCFYPIEIRPTVDTHLSEIARGILRLVAANPGLSLSEAGRQMGISRQLVAHHLARLEEAGFVERRGDGRNQGIYPVEMETAR